MNAEWFEFVVQGTSVLKKWAQIFNLMEVTKSSSDEDLDLNFPFCSLELQHKSGWKGTNFWHVACNVWESITFSPVLLVAMEWKIK